MSRSLDHRWRCPNSPDDLYLEYELHRLEETYPPPPEYDAWRHGALYAAAPRRFTRRERVVITRRLGLFAAVVVLSWLPIAWGAHAIATWLG